MSSQALQGLTSSKPQPHHDAKRPAWVGLAVAVTLVACSNMSSACVGLRCLEIWSATDGGGRLVVESDFLTEKVQTFQSFCAPDNSQCLYTTIDPGFMAPTQNVAGDPNFRLADGTKVRVVIVNAPSGLSLNVNGQKLSQPGESALLGTMPTIHNHPSWQLVVPGGRYGDYNLSFKLTTDSPAYSESQPVSVVVTNVPPPEDTPTATPTSGPTPAPTPCPGDCSNDLEVTIDEIILCVGMALGATPIALCPSCDVNGDGDVTIDEIIAAVNAALAGCPMPPAATLGEIQDTIFTPRCAIPTCHDDTSHNGNLALTAGESFAQLVNVPPDIASIRDAGILRVDPGHPENSFLLMKLSGPPRGAGSLMPLTGAALSAEQIQLVRDWIVQGAKP
ncbi:MAG: hypothetical protein HY270_24100 [Deltaproteobacteria bacterium]|nr:hypothetical protein [Deltaproteobacteria bacterium]